MEPSNAVAIELMIIPVDDEADEVAAIADSSDLLQAVRNNLAALENTTAHRVADGGRSDGIIEIMRSITQSVYDHRAELATLLTTAITAITALAKHRRIDEIEVSVGQEKMVLKGVEVSQAERMIRDFTERTASAKTPTEPKPRVTARTGKRK